MYIEEQLSNLISSIDKLSESINTLNQILMNNDNVMLNNSFLNNNDRILLNISTVMELLNISRTTVWRWVQEGYLEQKKLGTSRKVYITKSSINRLQEGKHEV